MLTCFLIHVNDIRQKLVISQDSFLELRNRSYFKQEIDSAQEIGCLQNSWEGLEKPLLRGTFWALQSWPSKQVGTVLTDEI